MRRNGCLPLGRAQRAERRTNQRPVTRERSSRPRVAGRGGEEEGPWVVGAGGPGGGDLLGAGAWGGSTRHRDCPSGWWAGTPPLRLYWFCSFSSRSITVSKLLGIYWVCPVEGGEAAPPAPRKGSAQVCCAGAWTQGTCRVIRAASVTPGQPGKLSALRSRYLQI